jgi:hypothetical protein
MNEKFSNDELFTISASDDVRWCVEERELLIQFFIQMRLNLLGIGFVYLRTTGFGRS